MTSDPIADMLTRIRNAKSIYHTDVSLPHSKIKEQIARKLKQEGFIKDVQVIEAKPQKQMKISLKYGPDGEQIIQNIERVSTPGRRVYKAVREINKILGGLGIEIISTPKGILTDRECRQNKAGGEILCKVW